MSNNSLDFDAPLLSVRRFSAPKDSNAPDAAGTSPLPLYHPDLKSASRKASLVPFVWEQIAGRPKDRPEPCRDSRPSAAPKLPHVRISDDKEPNAKEGDDDDDEDEFCDAVDVLSRTESFFMNCSVGGLSSIQEPPTGSFATDPHVRDFMMDRFLPAAQAAAVSLPQHAPRKQHGPARPPAERKEGREYRRLPPSPYSYGNSFVPRYREGQEQDEKDDEDYDDDMGHLPSKACGLLPRFWLKSSFCLLNPVPSMKVRSRLPPLPPARNSDCQAEDENSWEVVYKHKLGHSAQHQGEDWSRITSESNRLTYWSDSQTADGSSPNRNSAGGVSPYRNEVPRSPFHEGKSYLGVPMRDRNIRGSNGLNSLEKGSENNSRVVHSDGSHQRSGSASLAIDRTVYVDSVLVRGTLDSKSSSITSNKQTKGMLKPTGEDSEVGVLSQKIKDSLVLESSDIDSLQPKVSELVGYMGDDGSRCNDNYDDRHFSEVEDQVKTDAVFMPSLLPPPLPKTPSESWLSRTLPSVSSKNPPQQTFFGIQLRSRKQDLRAASPVQNQGTSEKPVKVHRQIRFADMLKKPLSPESEI